MTPEFSRLIAVDRVPTEGTFEYLTANHAERNNLANRFGIIAIHELSAVLKLEQWRRGGLKISGNMNALVEQLCVVTLESFESRIAEKLVRYFAGENLPGATPAVHTVESLEDDEADVIVAGSIDLGELVAETLGLGLDPYPRKPGVEFSDVNVAPPSGTAEGPFAALQAIKSDKSRRSQS